MNIQKTNTGWVGLAPVIVMRDVDGGPHAVEYVLRRPWVPQGWLDINTKILAPLRKNHGFGHVLKTGTIKKDK